MSLPGPTLERIRRLLCGLHESIRDALRASRARQARHFAEVAGQTRADTIYRIDRVSEAAILGWFGRHWPRSLPVELVMEGIEEGSPVTFPAGTPVGRTLCKCIIDPIDGTRGLMHDKRAAWALSALAPQRGARTHLGDLLVAVMTELPTTKQGQADQYSAVRGGGLRGIVATRRDVAGGPRRRLAFRPSGAADFEHGFASLVHFFPEGLALTARIEEELWERIRPRRSGGPPRVFGDQYLTTGGQIHELLTGRDRMIGDLRPLVYARLGLKSALVCHPYDICTAFLLAEAGGVVEEPLGGALRAPLDTTTPVAWMGYANPRLARLVRPALRRVLRKHLG
ncbi:MAG TPA: inositol monophosphatase [Opitutaceae bacterium]|nr:inositol monophosphatase [Opitutaceae bacterium]